MAAKFLLNTTRMGTDVYRAGTSLDSVTDATLIASIKVAGGQFCSSTAALVVAAAAVATSLVEGNADDATINAMMLAAAVAN